MGNIKWLAPLVFTIVGLLAVVIFVGLVRGTLDVTGVAVALIGLITGIMGGAFYRSRTDDKDGPGGSR